MSALPSLASATTRALRRSSPPSSELTDASTLAEARAHIHAHQLGGVICPACSQLVQLSPVEMTAELALALVVLHRVTDARRMGRPTYADAYVRVSDRVSPVYNLPALVAATPGLELASADGTSATDARSLRLWGFIEPTITFRLVDVESYWRITPLGRLFAMDQHAAPRLRWAHAVEPFEAVEVPADTPGARDVTTARAALAPGYDYDALMAAPANDGATPARREVQP